MKNPITTISSFRAVAMPLSMALLAVCVSRFAVAAEPQAGIAPEQQQRLELMKSQGAGRLADHPPRAPGGQTVGSCHRGGRRSSRTAGIEKH